MSVGFASIIMRDGIFQILIIAAPVLLIGMSVGLVISIFQQFVEIYLNNGSAFPHCQ